MESKQEVRFSERCVLHVLVNENLHSQTHLGTRFPKTVSQLRDF